MLCRWKEWTLVSRLWYNSPTQYSKQSSVTVQCNFWNKGKAVQMTWSILGWGQKKGNACLARSNHIQGPSTRNEWINKSSTIIALLVWIWNEQNWQWVIGIIFATYYYIEVFFMLCQTCSPRNLAILVHSHPTPIPSISMNTTRDKRPTAPHSIPHQNRFTWCLSTVSLSYVHSHG